MKGHPPTSSITRTIGDEQQATARPTADVSLRGAAAVALSNLIVAARLSADADYSTAFRAGLTNAQAMM